MNEDGLLLHEVTPRCVYKVKSRNLRVAVYAGDGRFVGIRTKFGRRFLDVEWHWDADLRPGNLWPLRMLGSIPDDVPLVESLGTICRNCRAPVVWTGPPPPAPWAHTEDTGCSVAEAIADANRALFSELDAIEHRFTAEEGNHDGSR